MSNLFNELKGITPYCEGQIIYKLNITDFGTAHILLKDSNHDGSTSVLLVHNYVLKKSIDHIKDKAEALDQGLRMLADVLEGRDYFDENVENLVGEPTIDTLSGILKYYNATPYIASV
jgi:hypothetical protein